MFITPKQLAARWPRYAENSLANRRSAGKGPVYEKLGHAVVYKLCTILQYEKKHPEVLKKNPLKQPARP